MTRGAARSTRAVGDAADLPEPAWPVEPPRAWVAHMDRSLQFYLRLGCEVRSAADGWALLGCGPTTFVLIPSTLRPLPHPVPADQPSSTGGWIRLTTPDVRALRWRLLADGVPAGPVITPATTAATTAEFEVADPDRRRVVIVEPARAMPGALTSSPPRIRRVPRHGSRPGTGHLVSIPTPRSPGDTSNGAR